MHTATRLTRCVLACALCLTTAWVAAQSPAVIRADGSDTVYPITEAVAEEFRQASKGQVVVNVVISGTGGGFAKFCNGETDISDASRPITRKEMDQCQASGVSFIEVPVGFDAITVTVNPQNDFVKSLTLAQLKRLWEPDAQGKVTRWNQLDPSYPDLPIRLYAPTSNNGTFDYFTQAVVGKAKASRTDYIASVDDYLLVHGVARSPGGIGYFAYAYYVDNRRRLKAVPIDSGKGPVMPSPESVADGSYAPLARPIFIYLNAKSLERPEVQQFVDYYMKNGPRIVKQTNYVPLSAAAYAANQTRIVAHKLGTVFADAPAGARVEDILAREGKS
jgi:phosphate transport system substrate-binding protein